MQNKISSLKKKCCRASAEESIQRILECLSRRAFAFASSRSRKSTKDAGTDAEQVAKSRLSLDYEAEFRDQVRLPDYDLRALEQPIENEEWIVFLQRSMEEIMDGEIGSLLQQNCVSVFVSPLRNPAAGCRVLEYVACLLSLPFVVPVSPEDLNSIRNVYLEVRVVPNLVYALKLLTSAERDDEVEDVCMEVVVNC